MERASFLHFGDSVWSFLSMDQLPTFSLLYFQCHKIPPRIPLMGIFLPVSLLGHLFVTITFPINVAKVTFAKFLCCMAGISGTAEVSTSPSSNHIQIHFQCYHFLYFHLLVNFLFWLSLFVKWETRRRHRQMLSCFCVTE